MSISTFFYLPTEAAPPRSRPLLPTRALGRWCRTWMPQKGEKKAGEVAIQRRKWAVGWRQRAEWRYLAGGRSFRVVLRRPRRDF